MRKYIISDIHGNGNLYYSIMSYLENVSKIDEVILYINGDLIDRGEDSAEILIDVINRMKTNPFKIVYLAGNHELSMYEIFEKRRKGIYAPDWNDWYINGGKTTDESLTSTLKTKEKILEVVDFISELPLYHKFDEKIDEKNIVVCHACCPLNPKDVCDSKITDNFIYYSLWARKDDSFMPFRCRIGNNNYFSIVGHTPNNNKYGYEYHVDENYLNIDGGSSMYSSGVFEDDHFPLVEVCNGFLKILTFNNSNEIIYGNYFRDYTSIPYSEEELDNERKLLSGDVCKKISRTK